ncbi:MAG TPA: hypothetical protein VK892_21695 [Pyrinomonadaceae bacterium]|nr:hypothetical protein [Pyrinomonadaceae bacterium]
MDGSTDKKECAHIPCKCAPEIGSEYCSFLCEKAFDQTDCSCGHEECQAEA